MRVFNPVVVLFIWFGPGVGAARGLEPITPVEAVHLVERIVNPRLEQERLLTLQAELLEVEGRLLYRIRSQAGQEQYEATVEARAARVLKVTRNGVSFYDWTGPRIVGHRGTVQFAPENTLPAFEAAIVRGVDLIEMDVRQTRDGELVILHDETVDRTTDGTGPVSQLTLEEVRRLDAGSWFAPEFKGVRVPTLKEALKALRGRALPDIDFKAGDPRRLVAVLREEGLLGKITFYCGDWSLLAQTRELTSQLFWRPTVPLGRVGLPLLVERFDPPIVNVDWQQFSEGLIRDIHLAGKKSFVNTMQHDTEWGIEQVLDTYPDYVQSDQLELLHLLLQRRGLRPDLFQHSQRSGSQEAGGGRGGRLKGVVTPAGP